MPLQRPLNNQQSTVSNQLSPFSNPNGILLHSLKGKLIAARGKSRQKVPPRVPSIRQNPAKPSRSAPPETTPAGRAPTTATARNFDRTLVTKGLSLLTL